MMGPNSMKMLEEMAESLKFEKGMQYLILAAGGRGLNLPGKEYDVTVLQPTSGSVQRM